jgi:hypothetical protein
MDSSSYDTGRFYLKKKKSSAMTIKKNSATEKRPTSEKKLPK